MAFRKIIVLKNDITQERVYEMEAAHGLSGTNGMRFEMVILISLGLIRSKAIIRV